MANRFLNPLLYSSLLSFIVFTPAVASAGAAGTCFTNTTKYVTSALYSSARSSTTFGNIPETGITFKTSEIACVIVRFSAQTFATGNNAVVITAHIGGAILADPVEVQYSGDDSSYSGAHSYEFIFPSVPKGNHSLHMQFRSVSGAVVFVDPHTTVVKYVGNVF